jgi:alkaline phosphatase D
MDPTIATEFCATSITTRGRLQHQVDAILRDNPHIHFGDSTFRGYVVFDVTAESCVARLRAVEDATDRRTGVSTAATFSVDAGRPGARRI